MKQFLLNNKRSFDLILSVIQSLVLGIYLSLISTNLSAGYSFFAAICKEKNSWIYLSISAISFICQLWLSQESEKAESSHKSRLINSILEEACRSLVYPGKLHVRAIVTMCDYKKQKRKTVYGYNIGISPERFAEYDIDFGVTGKAFLLRRPVAESLPNDHITTYDNHHASIVESRLKCVLAAPIFSQKNSEKVIGILAFDSTDTIEKLKFDSDSSKKIAQGWADIISVVLDE